jgi:hypothetical protein
MTPVTGRVPVPDAHPRARDGQPPAKSVPGEHAGTTTTDRREDHRLAPADLAPRAPAPHPAHRVPMPLGDPDAGCRYTTVLPDAERLRTFHCEGRTVVVQRMPMTFGDPGADCRYTTVLPDAQGLWTFHAVAWVDPRAIRHRDIELTPADGALPHERVPLGPAARDRREAVCKAAAALRATSGPPSARTAAVTTPRVTAAPTRHAPRDLVAASRPLPAVATVHLPAIQPTGTGCVRLDPGYRAARVLAPGERS